MNAFISALYRFYSGGFFVFFFFAVPWGWGGRQGGHSLTNGGRGPPWPPRGHAPGSVSILSASTWNRACTCACNLYFLGFLYYAVQERFIGYHLFALHVFLNPTILFVLVSNEVTVSVIVQHVITHLPKCQALAKHFSKRTMIFCSAIHWPRFCAFSGFQPLYPCRLNVYICVITELLSS